MENQSRFPEDIVCVTSRFRKESNIILLIYICNNKVFSEIWSKYFRQITLLFSKGFEPAIPNRPKHNTLQTEYFTSI